MINWGPVTLGTVLPFMWGSYDGTTGASETSSGLAVTDIEIYKAGGGLTQRSSDAGYTLADADGHDLDSITGLNGFTVDTGDNTDAGFFAAGGYYIVVVASVTIDTQTVNFIAGTFNLVAAPTVAGVVEVDVTHWNGTAVGTPDTAGYPKVTIKDGTGTGELDTASGVVLAKDHGGNALAQAGQISTLETTITNNLTVLQGNILSTALTESYATDGAAATLTQLLYQIWAMLAEATVSSTTVTVKKLDGTTSAMTFTLNDASSPTSITRAS